MESPVKVKDILELLSTIDPEAPVFLSHDGWEEEYYGNKQGVELLKSRGVIEVHITAGYVILNN